MRGCNAVAGIRLLAVSALVLLNGCTGGGDTPAQPAPELAGVWAGVWEGGDPALGAVGGTWVAEFAQSASQLSGPVRLLGDVDCMFGQALGGLDAQSQLSGTLDRAPCQLNQWRLTALSTGANTAVGSWTQSVSGAQGSLSGKRIATPAGPRVLSVHPGAGRPGTVVTIAGQALALPASSTPLLFDQAPQSESPRASVAAVACARRSVSHAQSGVRLVVRRAMKDRWEHSAELAARLGCHGVNRKRELR